MKKLCLILTLTLSVSLTQAQFLGDSVIVYVDNKVELKVSIPDYENLKNSPEIAEALTMFKESIASARIQVEFDQGELIEYSPGGSISVDQGSQKYIYQRENDGYVPTGVRDKAIINGINYQIQILTTDITQVEQMELQDCLERVIAQLPPKRSWSRSLYYRCDNGTLTELSERHITNSQVDYLELSVGAGAGLVRKEWVPDLSFLVSFGLNKKGVLNINPYISANMLFDFDSEGDTHINTFLNLGYAWNTAKRNPEPQMLGVEVGYLLSQSGPLFENTTMRLGLRWSPIDAVHVSPQLYFTDNFNTIFPGIRIGFGL